MSTAASSAGFASAPVAAAGPGSSGGAAGGRNGPGISARPLTVAWGDQSVDVVIDENLTVADVFALVLPADVDRAAAAVGGRLVHLDQTVAQARIPAGAVVCPAPAGMLRPGRPGAAGGLAQPGAGRRSTGPGAQPDAAGVQAHGIQGGAGQPAAAAEAPPVLATLGQTAAPGSGSSRAAMAVPIGPGPGRAARVQPSGASQEHASGMPSGAPSGLTGMPSGSPDAGVTAAFAVALVALSAVAVLLSRTTPSASIAPTTSPATLTWGLGTGVLLVAAGAALAQLRRVEGPVRHLVPAAGAVGGAVAAAALSTLDLVSVIGAASGAAFVALAGHPGVGPDRRVPWVWTAYSAVVGAIALAAMWSGAGLVPVALVLLALLTLLPRVLPSWVIDVDDAALIDMDRLSVTSWSPRERRGRSGLWRVTQRHVDDLVDEARTTQTAALIGLVVLSALSCLSLAGSLAGGVAGGPAAGLPPGAQAPGLALPIGLTLAAAAVAPMFTARAYRARLDRVLVRAAAGPPTLMLLLAFLPGMPSGIALVVAAAAVAVALALGPVAAAVGGGYRSLGAGRLADALEGLALVAVFPLALWASGILEWARGVLA